MAKLLRAIVLLTLPIALIVLLLIFGGEYFLRQTWAQTRDSPLHLLVFLAAIGFFITVIFLPFLAVVRALDKVAPPFPKNDE